MNNDQNNIFSGGQNPIPTTPINNQGISDSSVIPGTNLNPIMTSNQAPETNIPVQPIPSIVENNPVSNVPQEIMSNNVIPVTTNSIIPGMESSPQNGIVSSTLIQPNNSQNINSTPELKIESPSPFDIGISSNNNLENKSLQNSTVPTNTNLNSTDTQIPPLNNSQEVSAPNNFGDATPLTNENISSSANDNNVVSVTKYLGHIILFLIPIIGFIMLLVKAFGEKEDKNISNLAKAQLLLWVIIAIITIILIVVLTFFGVAVMM